MAFSKIVKLIYYLLVNYHTVLSKIGVSVFDSCTTRLSKLDLEKEKINLVMKKCFLLELSLEFWISIDCFSYFILLMQFNVLYFILEHSNKLLSL